MAAASRAPATLEEWIEMCEAAKRDQDRAKNEVFVNQLVKTKRERVHEHGALRQLIRRERGRYRAELKTHMLLLVQLHDRLATYRDATNHVHQTLHHMHATMSTSLAQFGVPPATLRAAYRQNAMKQVHRMLVTDVITRLIRKQRAMSAIKVAKTAVGPSIDDARSALRRIPGRERGFVNKHEAKFAATKAGRALIASIREVQDQAYEALALDGTTQTWLNTTHDQEQLRGLKLTDEMEAVLAAGRDALERVQQHQALKAQVHADVAEWKAQHFEKVDSGYLAALQEIEEERKREQEAAQALLANPL